MNEHDARIFVVNDDAALRRSLEYLFDSAGWRIVSFESAQAFFDRYDGHVPGCLVLDVRMPLISGLELQKVLSERGVLLPIVFLTGHGDVPVAVQAMKNGACDFLEKPCNDQALLGTAARAVTRCIERCRENAQNRELQHMLATLTPREREVMELVAAGKPNKLIARELAISEKRCRCTAITQWKSWACTPQPKSRACSCRERRKRSHHRRNRSSVSRQGETEEEKQRADYCVARCPM